MNFYVGVVVCLILIPCIIFYWMSKFKQSNRSETGNIASLIYSNYAYTGLLLPVVGIGSCILLSYMYHYRSATSTHCNVPNVVPTISAATGGAYPEIWVFRLSILLMSGQRFVDGYILYSSFSKFLPASQLNSFANYLFIWCHLMENFSLFGVSIVSSSEVYWIHELSFILWIFFQLAKSILHMFMFRRAYPNHLKMEFRTPWFSQVVSFSVNVLCLFLAGIVFYYHNKTCLPYVYSVFAVLEYTIVLSNITFNYSMMMIYINKHNNILVKFESVPIDSQNSPSSAPTLRDDVLNKKDIMDSPV
eukprot:TRINITY_DN6988_c0_g1_i2.p1 TRINITY_DN6988_c0_g1~~TRINITY_DN6988_c0_g1_i2.p1  ORF type:complete len:304 (-),score=18.25 TRINITY_DN6988_c0_g1_i2:77-988(-)